MCRHRADKAAEVERDVLAKIVELSDSDRVMAERVHAVVTAHEKFTGRCATLGFSDQAKVDEGVEV